MTDSTPSPPMDLSEWIARVDATMKEESYTSGPSTYIDRLLDGLSISEARSLRNEAIEAQRALTYTYQEAYKLHRYLVDKIDSAIK